jgi:hypothetical protein
VTFDRRVARKGTTARPISDCRGSEWTISGTTVEGERIEIRGCDLWTFGDDGKLARKGFVLEDPRIVTVRA